MSIFYLYDSATKKIEQLLLLYSLLGKVCSSLYYMIQTRSYIKYLINMDKCFAASYGFKPTRAIFSQCAQKNFWWNIYGLDNVKIQYHANF